MKKNLIKNCILKTVKENKGITLLLLAVILTVVALSLLPPQFMRIMIDQYLIPKRISGIPMIAGIYLLVLVLIGLADFLKGCLLTIFGQKMILSIRKTMVFKLERINAAYFSRNPTGFITSRFTTDVENIDSLFSDGIISMIIDCLKIVGIVLSIFIFSLPLGLFTLCLVPVLFFMTRFFQKKMLTAQIENLEQLGNVNNHISESIKNVTMIKLFSKEDYMECLYCMRLRDNFATKQKVNFYDSCYAPIVQTIRAVTIVLLVLLSASQLNLLGISIGMVAASIELMTNLLNPIESLGMELQNIQKGISGVRRINDFYNEAEDTAKDETLTAEGLLKGGKISDIAFEHLSFSYDQNQPVIKDFSIHIEGNSNVTFTGRTGIGKTTLFNLIMGLLQPTGGRILIGGIDAHLIPNQEKRKIFGYVEQNFQFITGSVAEQISLGDSAITQSQIEAACSFVGLHEYILNMENSYRTIVRNEKEFSWGQRQLLAIARAIVSNPAILLLDEITANLDSVTEEKVVTVLKQAGQGRTILSISHRMASILNCDKVIQMDAE